MDFQINVVTFNIVLCDRRKQLLSGRSFELFGLGGLHRVVDGLLTVGSTPLNVEVRIGVTKDVGHRARILLLNLSLGGHVLRNLDSSLGRSIRPYGRITFRQVVKMGGIGSLAAIRFSLSVGQNSR